MKFVLLLLFSIVALAEDTTSEIRFQVATTTIRIFDVKNQGNIVIYDAEVSGKLGVFDRHYILDCEANLYKEMNFGETEWVEVRPHEQVVTESMKRLCK